ncbi:MAG: NAD(P)/FAD-dependent oxidoreductase [Alphaproteobacteria bacterium]|uniref:NAD(P)/FAD-dependent oxidoreductase n=1 Tax=Maricaulis alexandrii TaxID=2570354 RepID=UPI001108B005|nr:NAD(P)/FAD-dependent oxidoreductase [Maricaulis alexandrii]MCR9266566.1 NAD(P)/FAD-dependent oxidoreductase [Alphaproteobacteria bacterium]
MAFETDVIIVGAGAVGLACARAFAARGFETIVLEREAGIGQGVSSRNSEVIHGGLYYPTGSLKARFCSIGRGLMYSFLDLHKVDHAKCGKLVVATEKDEVPRLQAILDQAGANGVPGMRLISGEEARALEPNLRAEAALVSPESGVMDSHGYMEALAGELSARGGAIALNTPFAGATPRPEGGFVVRTGGDQTTEVTTRYLVIAAGLGAQMAAAAIEGYPAAQIPKLHYGKGVYFALTGKAPFSHLVYPLPIPGALGTHYRRDLGGQGRFGPDLEFVETEDYSVDPARAGAFYDTIRRFWPDLPDDALVPDYAGIRPKLHGPGEAMPDWRIDTPAVHGLHGLITLFGIESPGLTGSLAIGEAVAGELTQARPQG